MRGRHGLLLDPESATFQSFTCILFIPIHPATAICAMDDGLLFPLRPGSRLVTMADRCSCPLGKKKTGSCSSGQCSNGSMCHLFPNSAESGVCCESLTTPTCPGKLPSIGPCLSGRMSPICPTRFTCLGNLCCPITTQCRKLLLLPTHLHNKGIFLSAASSKIFNCDINALCPAGYFCCDGGCYLSDIYSELRSVPNFQQCLNHEQMFTASNWCLPSERPLACPSDSWQRLQGPPLMVLKCSSTSPPVDRKWRKFSK